MAIAFTGVVRQASGSSSEDSYDADVYVFIMNMTSARWMGAYLTLAGGG